MKNEMIIRSVKDGTTLKIDVPSERKSLNEGDTFTVTVNGPSISAQGVASTYHAGSPALLFRDIAASWRGWKGEKKWADLEGRFSLSAETDSLGHITLTVFLRKDAYPHDWSVTVLLQLEAGSLEAIADGFEEILPISLMR